MRLLSTNPATTLSTMVLLILVSAATYLGAAAVQAQTQTDGIQVTDQGAQSQFPDQMRFYLTARSLDEIHEVRLFFKKSGQVSSAYRAVEFTPGAAISGQTLIRLGLGDSYLPPGTELQYYFEVRDRGQRVLRTPTQTFIYEDTRLQWRSITGGLITVYYSGAVTEARAKVVLDASQESMTRMVPVLGIQPTRPLRIVAYGSYQDMRGALPFRARAVQEQLVTEGQAFTDERVLLVLASNSGIRGIAAHEFSHLLVAEAAGTAIQRVPAWLNEGLAEYANPEEMPSYDRSLREAIKDGRLKPLWHLIIFGGTPDDIIIAYGHSSSVVDYLIANHGEGKIAELMRALKTTLDIDRALLQVYGFDQYGLDTAWRKSMGLEPLPPRETPAPPPTTQPVSTPSSSPTPGGTVAALPTPTAAAGPTANAPVVPPGAAGCNGASTDLAWLALLGAVAGMVLVRSRPRR